MPPCQDRRDFTLASGTPVNVAANGGTASVSVDYAPSAVGADSGNLNLTSNDANNPQSVDVALSGTGVEAAACDGLTVFAEWSSNGNGSTHGLGHRCS